MKNIISVFIATLLSLSCNAQTTDNIQQIDLSGVWDCSLGGTVVLPGTLDENHKGTPIEKKDETTHLSRLYSYTGRVSYTRNLTIPKTWKKANIYLHLERTKPSTVFIDNDSIGYSNNISTPQDFNLGHLKAGIHKLVIIVDNSQGVPTQLYANSHAYTEDTQTNWNGIIGKITLSLSPSCYSSSKIASKACFSNFHIEGQHFYANGHEVFLRGKHDACVWPLTGHVPMETTTWVKYLKTCQEYGINHIRFHSWCPSEAAFVAADSLGLYLQPELPFWGDFNAKDSILMNFLHKEGENILRTYGHHPSFVMLALGNELWGSIEKMKSFVDDFRKIAPEKLYTFGSNYYLGYQGVKPGMDYFTTCRVGGEGYGHYNTHTRGSFAFADVADGGMINHFYPNTTMDFYQACLTAKDTTGRGAVPVISHETAQFQSYPDYDEIKKYTGVLYPYNLEVFRNRLEKAGMLSQAKDFHIASGTWAVQLYKADIEMDLRTKNMAGFQLLDIQDYPGQGSAYIGILDAFMDNKGYTTPSQWGQFCSPVVPLALMEKFCYQDNELFQPQFKIANYGEHSLKGQKLTWKLENQLSSTVIDNGKKDIASGEMEITSDSIGLFTAGKISQSLQNVIGQKRDAEELILTLQVGEHINTYPVWVYRHDVNLDNLKKGITITSELNQSIAMKLEKGANVLWMPDSTQLTENTVGGLFITDYWNYRMFKTISENNKKPVSPGTLGIVSAYVKASDGTNYLKHPLLGNFPTSDERLANGTRNLVTSDWQWFSILKDSRPLILDNLPQDYRPVIQVIDNIERNHKLGLVMEFSVGKGKLLICMSNLEKAAQKPEGKAFYQSVLKYMQSDAFHPITHISYENLMNAISSKTQETKLKELNNISKY